MLFTSPEKLWKEAERRLPEGGVVGISGFGGAGKTVLAADIARDKEKGVDKPGVQLVHVDDYLDWPKLKERNADWNGIDFDSILNAHIKPFKAGTKPVKYLVVEGIAIFQKGFVNNFDLKIWVDRTLDEAENQGRQRDGAAQELWDNVWRKNDQDFFDKHDPKQYADILYRWH